MNSLSELIIVALPQINNYMQLNLSPQQVESALHLLNQPVLQQMDELLKQCNNRFKEFNMRLLEQTAAIKQKENKSDSEYHKEYITEQLEAITSQIHVSNNNIQKQPTQEQFNTLSLQVEDLIYQIQHKVNQSEYEEQTIHVNNTIQQMKDHNDQIDHKISQLTGDVQQCSKLMENIKQTNTKQCKESQHNHQATTLQLQRVSMELASKPTFNDIDKIKESINKLVQKQELYQISQQVNKQQQITHQCKYHYIIGVQDCLIKLSNFEQFIKQTDYNLLYKASKMEIEQIEKKLQQINTDVTLALRVNDDRIAQVIEQQNKCDMEFSTNDILMNIINKAIASQLEDQLGQYTIKELATERTQMMNQLSQKADMSDLIEALHVNTNKKQAEHFMLITDKIQNQIDRIKMYIIQFMMIINKAIDSNLGNVQKREINQIISSMELANKQPIRKFKSMDQRYQNKQQAILRPVALKQSTRLDSSMDSFYQRRLQTQKDSPKYYNQP